MKKKVYVVTQGYGEMYHIEAIFLNKQKAKNFAKYCRCSNIEAHTLFDDEKFEPMTMVEIECAFTDNDTFISLDKLNPNFKIYNTNNHIYDSNNFNYFMGNKFVFKRRIPLEMTLQEYMDSSFYKEHLDYMHKIYNDCVKSHKLYINKKGRLFNHEKKKFSLFNR